MTNPKETTPDEFQEPSEAAPDGGDMPDNITIEAKEPLYGSEAIATLTLQGKYLCHQLTLVDGSIDRLQRTMNSRIDTLQSKINNQFKTVNYSLETLENRQDRQFETLTNISKTHYEIIQSTMDTHYNLLKDQLDFRMKLLTDTVNRYRENARESSWFFIFLAIGISVIALIAAFSVHRRLRQNTPPPVAQTAVDTAPAPQPVIVPRTPVIPQ